VAAQAECEWERVNFTGDRPGARTGAASNGTAAESPSALERKIDEVSALHCLTPEEIKIVEGAAK